MLILSRKKNDSVVFKDRTNKLEGKITIVDVINDSNKDKKSVFIRLNDEDSITELELGVMYEVTLNNIQIQMKLSNSTGYFKSATAVLCFSALDHINIIRSELLKPKKIPRVKYR